MPEQANTRHCTFSPSNVPGAMQMHGEALIVRTGCAASLVERALSYTRIRALAAPAILVTMVAQVFVLELLLLSLCSSGDAVPAQQSLRDNI